MPPDQLLVRAVNAGGSAVRCTTTGGIARASELRMASPLLAYEAARPSGDTRRESITKRICFVRRCKCVPINLKIIFRYAKALNSLLFVTL